jgi:hypothetical protein
MAKYVFVYKGGKMAETEEAQQQSMAAWGAFLGGLGDALVDVGNPFGASAAVTASGDGGASSGLGGYSILNAASLGEATQRAQGCPVLADGGTVEVYETIEVSM